MFGEVASISFIMCLVMYSIMVILCNLNVDICIIEKYPIAESLLPITIHGASGYGASIPKHLVPNNRRHKQIAILGIF